MRTDLSELVFILDRSGSMAGLEEDTIGGYNSLLQKQKAEPGSAIVTTVLFDDRYELLHDRIPINGVAPITQREYYVRGSTALLDAVGRTISKIESAQAHTAEAERAARVLFVITTDGMENASREYTFDKVQQLVERQKGRGWEFLFLGANIDAIATAARFGIHADRAANFRSDGAGMRLNFEAVSNTFSSCRAAQPIGENWKECIDQYYEASRPGTGRPAQGDTGDKR